jgi:uncharacterized protein YbcI
MRQTSILRGMIVVAVSTLISLLGSAQVHTKPTNSEREELLRVRQLVWNSYFNNDQVQLKKLIGEEFMTINPGEEHWQNRAEFTAGAQAFAEHHGKLVSL